MYPQRKFYFKRITAWLLIMAAIFTVSCKQNKNKENNPEEEKINFGIGSTKPENFPVNNDSSMSESFAYANSIANTVQGFYTDGNRTHYALKNINMSLVHKLSGTDNLNVTEITNSDGISYGNQTLDVYLKDADGNIYYAGNSSTSGRVNTIRLGYYYYDSHVRDLGFAASQMFNYSAETQVDIKEGWKANEMTAPEYKNEELTSSVTQNEDPYIYKNGLNIKSGEYNAIEIEMRSEGSNQAALYYCTKSSGNFNGNQVVSFNINSDGKYHKYLVNLSGHGLDGTDITGLRFDVGASTSVYIKSIKAVKTDTKELSYRLDKTFHVYADKLHQEYRLVKVEGAGEEMYAYSEFGVEFKVAKENVLQYKIEYEEDGKTPVYAAIDVKDAGIIGFIMPYDKENGVSITEEDGNVVLRQYCTGENFGSRIYNDKTHDYAGIEKAALEERTPFTNITAEGDRRSGSKYLEYDSLRGAYKFLINGTSFSSAYYNNPNGYYYADISIENNSADKRNIYIWMNGRSGCLECATVADSNGTLVPIPTQVDKNFPSEHEEPLYDPDDKEYGDTFIPVVINGGDTLNFTIYNLYQNWGVFPIKQLSTVQFHISYYHLSTGVTESNCIAPYFVYGKDQWTLPDFRGCSGIMWTSQPQFNSVGCLRFVSYTKDGVLHIPEYTDSLIRSSGPSYADLDYNYVSDCGSYKYTLRHFEFPQNDENRTYYSLRLDFLKDLTVEDVKNNFTLFSFDGRFKPFSLMSYSDENGEHKEKETTLEAGFSEIIDIGKDNPYFSYYGLNDAATEITNFAYMIKDYDITIGNNKWDGNFALRNACIINPYTGTGLLNLAELSLMEDDIAFKAGDHIYMDFILLPWGTGLSKTDENVQYVIEDSINNPFKLEVTKGKEVKDTYLPEILSENNEAEFTLSGGRNRFAVRVDGMTSMNGIAVTELINGEWTEYVFSTTEFDGYQVVYNKDGTYSYVFIVEMDDSGSPREFNIKAL